MFSHGGAEAQRAGLLSVSLVAHFFLSYLSVSLWLCEETSLRVNDRHRRCGEPQTTASGVHAMDRSNWFSRRHGATEGQASLGGSDSAFLVIMPLRVSVSKPVVRSALDGPVSGAR